MPSLRHTIYIACRPEELWACLTEGARTRQWYMGAAVESSFEPGATIEFYGNSVPDGPHDDDHDLAGDSDDEPGEPDIDDPESREPPAEIPDERTLALSGVIAVAEPEQRLEHTFSFAHLDDPPSRVRWTLSQPEGAPGVVRLDLEHTFAEGGEAGGDDSESLATARQCWPMALSGLKTWLETGAALDLPGLSG